MKRLRTKMLLAMVMIAIAVFVFLGAAMIFFISNSIEKSIVISMKPMAESAADDFDETLTMYINSVTNTTASEGFIQADDDEARIDMLKSIFTKNNNQYISDRKSTRLNSSHSV